MTETIITFYCFCDDLIKALGCYRDDRQARLTTAEVMTVVFTAVKYFGGCFESARVFLLQHGYMPNMLGKSRLNRRIHQIPPGLWLALGQSLAEAHKQLNPSHEYLVDSMPLAACDNIRISRSKIYQGETYRGKIASKKRFFYGLRLHLITTVSGEPVEMQLWPGATAEVTAFKYFSLDLPEDAVIYADRGYTDYVWEDLIADVSGIQLMALRKHNSHRPLSGWWRYVTEHLRKRIETTFSQIAALLGRVIRAVTPLCFELKCFMAVWAIAF